MHYDLCSKSSLWAQSLTSASRDLACAYICLPRPESYSYNIVSIHHSLPLPHADWRSTSLLIFEQPNATATILLHDFSGYYSRVAIKRNKIFRVKIKALRKASGTVTDLSRDVDHDVVTLGTEEKLWKQAVLPIRFHILSQSVTRPKCQTLLDSSWGT